MGSACSVCGSINSLMRDIASAKMLLRDTSMLNSPTRSDGNTNRPDSIIHVLLFFFKNVFHHQRLSVKKKFTTLFIFDIFTVFDHLTGFYWHTDIPFNPSHYTTKILSSVVSFVKLSVHVCTIIQMLFHFAGPLDQDSPLWIKYRINYINAIDSDDP